MNEKLDIRKMRAVAQAMRNDYADRQIFGQLANCEGGLCAIGVLCDIAAKEYPKTFEWRLSLGHALFLDKLTGHTFSGVYPLTLDTYGYTNCLELPVVGRVGLVELNDPGMLDHVACDHIQYDVVCHLTERYRTLTLPQIAECIDFYLNNLERQEIEVTA